METSKHSSNFQNKYVPFSRYMDHLCMHQIQVNNCCVCNLNCKYSFWVERRTLVTSISLYQQT